MSEYDIKPKHLALEMTETSFMSNAASAAEILEALHALGVKIAIDDFGTGYSSLTYLKRLPVDYLKIDKNFIHDIISKVNDAAIVRGIIELAHSLSLEVIAEGVETQAQLDFLKQHHCDQVQGFFFSQPLAPEKVIDYIRQHS